jgi:hypothetical protein
MPRAVARSKDNLPPQRHSSFSSVSVDQTSTGIFGEFDVLPEDGRSGPHACYPRCTFLTFSRLARWEASRHAVSPVPS